jgi:hypothetical protein
MDEVTKSFLNAEFTEESRFQRRVSDVSLPDYFPHPFFENMWSEGDDLFRARIQAANGGA